MRTAPAVQVVVAGPGAWRWVQAALFALTATLLSVWLMRLSGWAGAAGPGTAAICGLATGALALWWFSVPPQRLGWDGNDWNLATTPGAGWAGQAAVMVDLGGWMLLRFQTAAGRPVVWLPLSRRSVAGDWHGLRAALFAARPTATLAR